MPKTADAILMFWFSEEVQAAWFVRSEAVDQQIAEQFASTYEAARSGELDSWRDSAREALALTITLDQFPRNLFRGSPRSFESDHLGLAVGKHALDKGFDQELTAMQRQFFYLPLMHSENEEDQQRCVSIYENLDNDNALDFARQHRDIIVRFGRFPHRNAVLGRETSAEEAEFLKEHKGF